jgi:hypothetical protein
MKTVLLILVFIAVSHNLNAQGLKPVDVYLKSKDVSQVAKDYYNKKFKVGDNDSTFSITDSLNTKNNVTRPFYIYLTTRMLYHSDGALFEGLGVYCKEFIETHPNQLATYIVSLPKLQKERTIDAWAMCVASEFYIACAPKERECIDESFNDAIKKCSTASISVFKDVYCLIRHYCANM